MDTILHNSKCWYTTDGRLEIYNARLATRLNKYFKKYESGSYVFKDGEEAVYQVPKSIRDLILNSFLTKESI